MFIGGKSGSPFLASRHLMKDFGVKPHEFPECLPFVLELFRSLPFKHSHSFYCFIFDSLLSSIQIAESNSPTHHRIWKSQHSHEVFLLCIIGIAGYPLVSCTS